MPPLAEFRAVFWKTAHASVLSALSLQRTPGPARCKTARLILHKLRRAMADATREPMSCEQVTGREAEDHRVDAGARPG